MILKAEVEKGAREKLEAMAQNLPHTKDLPLRPADPNEAKDETVYYGEALRKEEGATRKVFRPERYIRKSDGPGRFRFVAGCLHGVGAKEACCQQRQNGRPFCQKHGGKRAAGEAATNRCRSCNSKQLSAQRQLSAQQQGRGGGQ